MKKIELNRRQATVIIGAIFSGIVIFLIVFAYRPLAVKIRLLRNEFQRIEQELEVARDIIGAEGDLGERGRLLTRKETSLAIDEITYTGRALNINFISINPKEIEKLESVNCLCLPIYMDLESEYKDLGLFLGALEKLKESIVTVRSFKIYRDERILPLVKSRLAIELYLRSERGKE